MVANFAVERQFPRYVVMFSSILGMWLPLSSIFAATWLTGIWVAARRARVNQMAGRTGSARRFEDR